MPMKVKLEINCLYILAAIVIVMAGAFLLHFGSDVIDVILYPYK